MLDFIVKNLCSTEDSNQHLNAPTGILLGATDQESASSSERLTCYMCVNVEFLVYDFVFRRGRGRREKEGYSAHLIQKLAMACLNL